jgi:hypothetical protein
MLMLEFLKLPFEQMVNLKMQKLLICLVLPLKILCMIGVIVTWETTQTILLHNCS